MTKRPFLGSKFHIEQLSFFFCFKMNIFVFDLASFFVIFHSKCQEIQVNGFSQPQNKYEITSHTSKDLWIIFKIFYCLIFHKKFFKFQKQTKDYKFIRK